MAMSKTQNPIPREHGAWGLLFVPFVAAALLGGRWDPLLIPAFLLALVGFLIREPLTMLARWMWAGHRWSAPMRSALRWLLLEAVVLSICYGFLVARAPQIPLLILVLIAVAFTALSVWFSLRNRQRAIGLQLAAVAGLGSSAFLAVLATGQNIPNWTWWLWALFTVHGAVAVICVHARLQLRIADSRGLEMRMPWMQLAALALQASLMVCFVVLSGLYVLLTPVLFSLVVNGAEVLRLQRRSELRTPLPRVGFRMLAQSIGHAIALVCVLWRHVG